MAVAPWREEQLDENSKISLCYHCDTRYIWMGCTFVLVDRYTDTIERGVVEFFELRCQWQINAQCRLPAPRRLSWETHVVRKRIGSTCAMEDRRQKCVLHQVRRPHSITEIVVRFYFRPGTCREYDGSSQLSRKQNNARITTIFLFNLCVTSMPSFCHH